MFILYSNNGLFYEDNRIEAEFCSADKLLLEDIIDKLNETYSELKEEYNKNIDDVDCKNNTCWECGFKKDIKHNGETIFQFDYDMVAYCDYSWFIGTIKELK